MEVTTLIRVPRASLTIARTAARRMLHHVNELPSLPHSGAANTKKPASSDTGDTGRGHRGLVSSQSPSAGERDLLTTSVMIFLAGHLRSIA